MPQKYDKEYYIKNLKKHKEEYYIKNREEILGRSINWYKNNSERARERNKSWQKNNLEKGREREKRWYKNNNLNCRLSSSIRKSLRCNKNGRKWENLVGYTLNDLIKRLNKTIPEGYVWQDYFKGKLHIDHIIPMSAWDFDSPKQINFRKCWSLENLRLLPAEENKRKNNKLEKSFQLTLKI